MIERFMLDNPHILIEVVETVDYDNFLQSLHGLAAQGNLPDLIALSDMPEVLAGGFLMDISSLALADPEWRNIPANVADTLGRGGIFAIPFGLYAYGFYVNDEMFDNAGIERLQVGFSFAEMMEAVKALTDPGNGMIGLSDIDFFPDWIPYYLSDYLGHYTWDGTRFNFDSPEFIQGVEWCAELIKGRYTLSAFDDDDWEAMNAGWFGDLWQDGRLALAFEPTWWMGYFEWTAGWMESRFIGMPGNKNIVIPDYLGISAHTQNPQAVYDFAKWMSFGSEGFLHRIELRDFHNIELETLPPTADQRVWDAFLAGMMGDYRLVFADINNAAVDGEMSIPGFGSAIYDTPTGIPAELWGIKIEDATVKQVIYSAMFGHIDITEHVNTLNDTANERAAQAQAEIEAFLGR
jgi:multiple sugar transport system substrate-binding protein